MWEGMEVKFLKRVNGKEFLRRIRINKHHHMTTYAWGYWVLVIRNKDSEKTGWHNINNSED
jgi:hypothetical protein